MAIEVTLEEGRVRSFKVTSCAIMAVDLGDLIIHYYLY